MHHPNERGQSVISESKGNSRRNAQPPAYMDAKRFSRDIGRTRKHIGLCKLAIRSAIASEARTPLGSPSISADDNIALTMATLPIMAAEGVNAGSPICS
ncbi:hypothetical protein KM043_011108 [Ampulex compressa]|nr:hypothetical protein KM043_011108 [Ampulex compressa]